MTALAASAMWIIVPQVKNDRPQQPPPAIISTEQSTATAGVPTASMTGEHADLQRKWSDCRDKLLWWRQLGGDWDGEGAAEPSLDIIDGIVSLVQSPEGQAFLSLPPDDVNALRDGTISLEWYRHGSQHKIVRFDSPSKAQVIIFSPGMPTKSYWEDFSITAQTAIA